MAGLDEAAVRRMANEEVRTALLSVGIDLNDRGSRDDTRLAIEFASDHRKQTVQRRDRMRAHVAGLGWGVIGTLLTGAIGWSTGLIQLALKTGTLWAAH